jgi:hypothetical protein
MQTNEAEWDGITLELEEDEFTLTLDVEEDEFPLTLDD